MDTETIKMILVTFIFILSLAFILLICLLPVLCIMEKEKQRKEIMNSDYPKLQE